MHLQHSVVCTRVREQPGAESRAVVTGMRIESGNKRQLKGLEALIVCWIGIAVCGLCALHCKVLWNGRDCTRKDPSDPMLGAAHSRVITGLATNCLIRCDGLWEDAHKHGDMVRCSYAVERKRRIYAYMSPSTAFTSVNRTADGNLMGHGLVVDFACVDVPS